MAGGGVRSGSGAGAGSAGAAIGDGAPPSVHPTASVEEGAVLAEGVVVEARAVVGPEVRLGEGVRVGAGAVLYGRLAIGAGTRVWPGTVLGGEPQMLRYQDGGAVEIGARCQVREHATVHRGSQAGRATVVGDEVLLMSTAHVAHDGSVGRGAVLANGALLAGHVTVGERAILSGHALVHQFVRVGTRAMVAGGARVARDVPPFALVLGDSEVVGLNLVGLRRAGVAREAQRELRELFRVLYERAEPLERALARAEALAASPEGRAVVEFFRAPSKRGFCRGRLDHAAERGAS